MKKIALLVLIVFCGNVYSQKKKASPKVTPPLMIAKGGNNSSAEIIKNKFYLFVNNATAKDTLLLKTYPDKGTPLDCKITTFTTKGTPMYLVVWTEKQTTTATKLKTEDNTITESQIWNPATKTLITGNTQSVTKIKEIVFLDKLKTASETQEKTRRSGYEFTFLGEDFTLSDKSSNTKYSYNPASMKYEVPKGKATTTAPKKKRR